MKLFHDILNKTNPGGRIKNKEYYFKEGITYSDISGLNFAGRYTKNSIFDVKGSSTFFDSDKLFYFLEVRTELMMGSVLFILCS